MEKVLVLCQITCKPAQGAALTRTLYDSGLQTGLTRVEGCLQFELFVSSRDPDRVLFLEKWESLEAQQAFAAGALEQKMLSCLSPYATDVKTEKHLL